MAKMAFWSVTAGGVVAAVIAASVALTVPAGAGIPGQAVAAGQLAAGLSAAGLSAAADGDPTSVYPAWCDRLRKGQDRRHAIEARLQADATTRGSIAWLNAGRRQRPLPVIPPRRSCSPTGPRCAANCSAHCKTVTADVDAVIAARCN